MLEYMVEKLGCKRAGEPLDGETIRCIRMEREQQEAEGAWTNKRKEQRL